MVRKMNFQTVPLANLPLKVRTEQADAVKPLVLVVDDEAVIADTRAKILEHGGITAMVAYDARSALEIAKTIPPDLLLTDVAMPGMNGIDLAIAVRQIVPQCVILLFSGQASSEESLDAAHDAGHEFTILAKPLHPTEWLARIASALKSRTRHKESPNPNAVAEKDEQVSSRKSEVVVMAQKLGQETNRDGLRAG